METENKEEEKERERRIEQEW